MANRKQKSKNSKELMDRISVLPLPIVHHLLSFLPAQDIVRTSLLSKQWRTIWCSVPSLDFDECPLYPQEIEFVDFVNSFLMLRDGSNIHKFKLFLLDDCEDEHDEELVRNKIKWIMYAIRHNVQVLDFFFPTDDIEFPPQIFMCQSLKELKLTKAELSLPVSFFLPALKTLHLSRVIFQDHRLGKVLSTTFMHSLETLIIEDCYFDVLKLLVISVISLKKLLLSGNLPSSIEITTPNLSSLEMHQYLCAVLGDSELKTLMFKTDLTNLTCASIMLRATCFKPMTKIFRLLQNTHSLTLSGVFTESLVKKLEEILTSIKDPFHNLKYLKFETTFRNSEIKVLSTIIRHSLLMETIVLKNAMDNNVDYDKAYKVDYGEEYEGQNVWFADEMAKLKCITIEGFQGSANELRFVEVVMKSAPVLDELIILTSKTDSGNKQEFLKIGKKLRALPRASPSVMILFQ